MTCRVDHDCFLGHICLNNRCIFGCHNDEDCGASESCRNNRCINPCIVNPCGPNTICTVSNHRASCSCLDGTVASPTAKIGCVRSPAQPCIENRNCPQGYACFNELCRAVCANDAGCMQNERCHFGACKPICRRDDDCRNGDVCSGLSCIPGCRTDTGCPNHLACQDQQCVDPCLLPGACGPNARCLVVNHKRECTCEEPLIGDGTIGCKYPLLVCGNHDDCPPNYSCYANVCQTTCHNDQNCLSDERCLRGTCRTICNSDTYCGHGQICENRVCQKGCRTDNSCDNQMACINKQCADPCKVSGQCGMCARCTVINHGVQCSCPHGSMGDPLLKCNYSPEKCNDGCTCDENGIFCSKKCTQESDCVCGQKCSGGKCRPICQLGNCPSGFLCKNEACYAGCEVDHHCSVDHACTNGQCVSPCDRPGICGKNAICRVSDHQPLCLCPDGSKGDARIECVTFDCQKDTDCEFDKRCDQGICRNPCLESGACGINAQCRVNNHQSQCTCPPRFFGNPLVECHKPSPGACARNPCGNNARCRDITEGYECTCPPGCIGDARIACDCGVEQKNVCAHQPCGLNAACRVLNQAEPQCYCPPEYPNGDPYTECMLY